MPRRASLALMASVQSEIEKSDSPSVSIKTEQMIDVGDIRLHVMTQGSGPPVLLLHGFPEYWYSWRHQMRALAEAGYSAIAPDLRGYNLSDKPRGVSAYRVEELADDIEGLLAALGHKRAHIIGHDWGGYLAFYLAAHRRNIVSRLAVLNGPHPKIMARELMSPRQLSMSWYLFFFQLPKLPERLVATRKGMERVLRGASGPFLSERDLDLFVKAIQQPGAARAAINWYRAALRSPQKSLQMPKIEAPTLVLWGERDPHLGLGQLRGLEREARHLKIQRFADAGHWLQQERPHEVNAAILDFLRESDLDLAQRV